MTGNEGGTATYRVLVNGTNVYEGEEPAKVLEEMYERSKEGDKIEIFQQEGTLWKLIDSESEMVQLIRLWHELAESSHGGVSAKPESVREDEPASTKARQSRIA